MSLIKIIGEISKIPPLQGQDDWPEWERRLEGLLGVQGLWETLTGDTVSKDGSDSVIQGQLASMLQLICSSSVRSVIALQDKKNATKQYQALKKQYGSSNIVTFSTLMHIVFRGSSSSYESVREYYEAVAEAKNRLIVMGRLQDELAVVIAFIWGLDHSFDQWREHFLAGHIKIIMIEKSEGELKLSDVVKLLENRELVSKIGFIESEKSQAFSTKRSKQHSRKKGDCTHCEGDHEEEDC